jgi:hypothetical protein
MAHKCATPAILSLLVVQNRHVKLFAWSVSALTTLQQRYRVCSSTIKNLFVRKLLVVGRYVTK